MSDRAELFVQGYIWTTNGERKASRWNRSEWTSALRKAAFVEAKQQRTPRFTLAEVSVRPVQSGKGKLADTAGHAPAVKAVIDGLVDAGVLVDDSPAHLQCITFHPPIRSTRRGIQVIIRELT